MRNPSATTDKKKTHHVSATAPFSDGKTVVTDEMVKRLQALSDLERNMGHLELMLKQKDTIIEGLKL